MRYALAVFTALLPALFYLSSLIPIYQVPAHQRASVARGRVPWAVEMRAVSAPKRTAFVLPDESEAIALVSRSVAAMVDVLAALPQRVADALRSSQAAG